MGYVVKGDMAWDLAGRLWGNCLTSLSLGFFSEYIQMKQCTQSIYHSAWLMGDVAHGSSIYYTNICDGSLTALGLMDMENAQQAILILWKVLVLKEEYLSQA